MIHVFAPGGSRDGTAQARLLSTILLALIAGTAQAADSGQSYYVEPGTYSTQREPDPPSYTKDVGTAYDDHALDWLDAGVEYRLRYEDRHNDIRRPDAVGDDHPLLQRTRLYAGIHDVLDPLRFVVELQDSREFHSRYAPDVRDVDHLDVIQGYAELRWPAALGTDARGNQRQFDLRAGRFAFDELDRRLVARNEWRNTTNAFDGVRVQIGNDNNAWALDAWSLQPVTRLLTDPDKPNQDQRFDGVIAHLRPWSEWITLEPHYFRLVQDSTAATAFHPRDILAPGLRVYGKVLNDAVNYDLSVMKQHGSDNGQRTDGEAFTAEAGYSWNHLAWQPHLSASYGYASGDRNPKDNTNDRFERFFGFGRSWSADDYIVYENIRAPKIRLEIQPIDGVHIDGGYNWFRLASTTDRLTNLLAGAAFNRDSSGKSGGDVGNSWDVRVRFSPIRHWQTAVGYSSFVNGDFVKARQVAATGTNAAGSSFFYVELTWRWLQ
ncbi:MAG TPA: alginate export family protein [Candidatus Acidoferrum sp.]|nr:alginate export family protein [Candidatus Acidoferrum sp.]